MLKLLKIPNENFVSCIDISEFEKIWCDLFCLFKLQNSRKLKFIEHPSHLHEYIDTDNCGKMPGTTLALEEDLKVYKDALKLSHKDTKVALKVTAYFANLFSWIFKILSNNKNNLVHFNEKSFKPFLVTIHFYFVQGNIFS